MFAMTERELMHWLRQLPTDELENLHSYQKETIYDHKLEIIAHTQQVDRLTQTTQSIQRVISEREDGA